MIHIHFNGLNQDSILSLIKNGPWSLRIKITCSWSLVRGHTLYDINVSSLAIHVSV